MWRHFSMDVLSVWMQNDFAAIEEASIFFHRFSWMIQTNSKQSIQFVNKTRSSSIFVFNQSEIDSIIIYLNLFRVLIDSIHVTGNNSVLFLVYKYYFVNGRELWFCLVCQLKNQIVFFSEAKLCSLSFIGKWTKFAENRKPENVSWK